MLKIYFSVALSQIAVSVLFVTKSAQTTLFLDCSLQGETFMNPIPVPTLIPFIPYKLLVHPGMGSSKVEMTERKIVCTRSRNYLL